jgi:dTDP-glucose pyrophosphorylase
MSNIKFFTYIDQNSFIYINNILIITTKQDNESYQRLLGDGSRIGLNIKYKIQYEPRGLADAFIIGKDFINNDSPLFFANSDQFVEWDSNEFMYKMNESNVDGGILVFESTHPKWSFAKIDDSGYVTEVAEKNPISNLATVGFYYWKKGSDFVKYAEQMIEKDIRVNKEFYVCPVFNQAIQDNKKIKTFSVEKMWGLGTPEDLEKFLKNKI